MTCPMNYHACVFLSNPLYARSSRPLPAHTYASYTALDNALGGPRYHEGAMYKAAHISYMLIDREHDPTTGPHPCYTK